MPGRKLCIWEKNCYDKICLTYVIAYTLYMLKHRLILKKIKLKSKALSIKLPYAKLNLELDSV